MDQELDLAKKQSMPDYRTEFVYKDGAVSYLWGFLLPMLLAAVCTFVMALANCKDKTVLSVVSAIITQGGFIAYYFLFCKKNKIKSFSAGKITHKINWLFWLLCALVSVCCVFGFSGFVSVIDYVISLTGYVSSAQMLPLDSVGWLFANIALLAVLPAIGEELLFRGIIINSLKKKYSPHIAIILSAVLFSLFHANISQTIYPLLMGIVLGYAAHMSGCLLCSMLVHFLNNTLVIVTSYFSVGAGYMVDAKFVGVSVALFVVTCAVLVGIWFLANHIKKKNSSTGDGEVVVTKKSISSVSLYYIVMVVILVVMWIIDLVIGIGGIK